MPKSYNRKADLSDSKPCPLSPILCFLGDSSTGISNHQVCSTHRAPEQGQEGQGEVQIQEFLCKTPQKVILTIQGSSDISISSLELGRF